MKERFEGNENRPFLTDAMRRQKVLIEARDLIDAFIDIGTVEEIEIDKALVTEGADDTDLYFILAGRFEIRLKGNSNKGIRAEGDLVGDFVGTKPSRRRTATLIAMEPNAVLRVSLKDFHAITSNHAEFWKAMTVETNARLIERNEAFAACNDIPRVLIFSSSEARTALGEIVINLATGDEVIVEPWDQVFAVSSYPVPDLIEALDRADFAVAIASADDVVISRKETKAAPRDNISFEFGLAIGTLGLDRVFLVAEDRKDLKLPSDTFGLNRIPYKDGPALQSTLAAACVKISKRIDRDGVRMR